MSDVLPGVQNFGLEEQYYSLSNHTPYGRKANLPKCTQTVCKESATGMAAEAMPI